MTGQLSGTLDGRPVELFANGGRLELRFGKFASAWRLRNVELTVILPVLRLLRHSQIAVSATVGRISVDILPRPNFALRFLAPQMYRVLSEGDL